MSTSYKPALLKALVRIARHSTSLEVPLIVLGSEFVQLFWVQTVVFHLRQASTITKEPEVVRAIRTAAADHKIRDLQNLPPEARTVLDRKMAKILRINVLELFHKSAPESMRRLYEWPADADHIVLTADSLHFLRSQASAIESIANLWWARYLEKTNTLAPRIIVKVERDDAQRGSLTRYLRILRQTDDPACFYCRRPLDPGRNVHVDHVIPWSFLLEDPMWDLVLACAACNLAKSDVLPSREFLSKLSAANVRRARVSLPTRFASPLLTSPEIERLYDAALAVEWPSGWSPIR
jgi:hypothetical protein